MKPIQRLANARATAANSCRKLEQRTVPRTDQIPFVRGQEMVGKSFERDELMRATINVCVHCALRLHDHDVELIFPLAKNHIPSTRIGEFADAAEENQTTPPARQMICHSFGFTGCTDRREFLTRTMS